MKLKLVTLTFLTLASCHKEEARPPQRVNIEVTGSPECLAEVVGSTELPTATFIVWTDNVGKMEFGPVESSKASKAMDQLRATKCIKTVRRRPCRIQTTDADACPIPERHS
jgi:hypothetical protein